jgi:hypothetical protein
MKYYNKAFSIAQRETKLGMAILSVVWFPRRVPEQDDSVQPRGAAARGVPAAGCSAAHRLQPPLLLRRSRPLG